MDAPTRVDFQVMFRQRRDLCGRLLELSRRQDGLIASDEYTELLAVLSAKQRVLGQLDELKRRAPNLLARWRESRDALDASDRERCEHLLAESEAIVAELIDEERRSTENLVVRRDAARGQLQTISQGSRVHRAYRDNLAPVTHRHLDVDR